MKAFFVSIVVVAALAAVFVGCKSTHEEGVTSDLLSQWANVPSDPPTTTGYAKDVYSDIGLKEIAGESTAVDGKVTGKKADGTKVVTTIKKVAAGGSQVSVSVGTMGEPTLGADIVARIKTKAGVK